jgi:homoserine O-acetyltransferase
MFLTGGKAFSAENDHFNPDEHFVICANVLGSPYGTVNPLSTNPATGQPYYLAFPEFTIRDIVKGAHAFGRSFRIDHIENTIRRIIRRPAGY